MSGNFDYLKGFNMEKATHISSLVECHVELSMEGFQCCINGSHYEVKHSQK